MITLRLRQSAPIRCHAQPLADMPRSRCCQRVVLDVAIDAAQMAMLLRAPRYVTMRAAQRRYKSAS